MSVNRTLTVVWIRATDHVEELILDQGMKNVFNVRLTNQLTIKIRIIFIFIIKAVLN